MSESEQDLLLTSQTETRLNLDEPRWDQSTFEGRAKHFFNTTDPRTAFASDTELDRAKELVVAYKKGAEPKGTTVGDVYAAKKLYDSAFHPQTGEKNMLLGRMSFQVPGNMTITGCMMTFYKSTPAVVFWQVMNQSFNALVNYTNRNASSPVSKEQLGQAYVGATTASVGTALALNKLVSRSPKLQAGLVGRLVPLVAVAAANCLNVPLMRQRELVDGIFVSTEWGEEVGKSATAAQDALMQVVPSRILMAVPGMVVPPLIMSRLQHTSLLKRQPGLAAPITVGLAGLMLCFSTPLACAVFPQTATIGTNRLEPELKAKVDAAMGRWSAEGHSAPSVLYYNKGL